MCGIGGYWGEPADLAAMIAAMHHRGPDDTGSWTEERVGLANVRLAIQDLSPAGHMPMTDGERWLTYNGEIYNFIQLRAELEAFGHHFHSGSDTEVVLAAYRQWGVDCVQHLRGMFAFALYDPANGGQLFLARDHFGIKPLYWTQTPGAFLFASEVRTLLATNCVQRRLDRQAVWDYLSFGSVLPPRTIIAGVHALLPGHAMLVRDGDIQTWRWWNLVEAASAVTVPTTFDEAAVELRRLLEESVKLQMIADVPVGAFLSGGIDSTTLVGLMSATQPAHTYSVAFATRDYSTSELPFAQIVANKYGSVHEEIVYTEADIAKYFPTIVAALDQPSGDGVNSYVVSQAARRGLTVSLSGLGSDELFAGYPQFARFQRVSQSLLPNGSTALKSFASATANVIPKRYGLRLEFLAQTPVQRHAMIRRVFAADDKTQWLGAAWLDNIDEQSIERYYANLLPAHLDTVAQVSYVELHGYMAHTLLRDVDNMSMAHSLEVRVPFLDPVLAAFVFALPSAWKLTSTTSKYILKQAVADLLPPEIVNRPKKGFDLPITTWVNGCLRDQITDLLQLGVDYGLFKSDVRHLHKPHFLWHVAILALWIESNQCSWEA